MTEWVETLVTQIEQWPPVVAYGALALTAFLENIVPPIPGDLVVVLSAYLVGRGVLEWVPVYLVTCAGGTVGFYVMYLIGRSGGRAFIRGSKRRARVFSEERLSQAESWLQRYGPWLMLANRFLTGVRTVIALAAGTGGMGWRPVLLLGGISMLLWNGALLYAGWVLGQNWTVVTDWVGRYNRIVGIGMVTAIVIGLAWRWWARRREARQGELRVDSPSEEA